MRRAAQRDANEPDLVELLRERGASVTLLSAPGVPDLLVGYQGVTLLLEVKMPLGPRGGSSDHQHLTDRQEKWWAAWLGATPLIVRSAADVHAVLDAIDGVRRVYAANVHTTAARPRPARRRS